jgi:preprotein translocase subunit SecA
VPGLLLLLLLQLLPEHFYYAIVDEVDSILIDESRNPMLISQPLYDNQETVATVNRVSNGTWTENRFF